MPKQDDLATIAQRMRSLVDAESNDETFLTALWRLTRRAMDEGAFREVEFAEFVGYFGLHREAETYNTRRPFISGQVVEPMPVARLPLTMLEGLRWLAINGSEVGLSVPADMPKLENLERVSVFGGSGAAISHIKCPCCDVLRPHVEVLASLIEASGQGGKAVDGVSSTTTPKVEPAEQRSKAKRTVTGRRRRQSPQPKPLTPKQTEALKLHGDCQNNIAEIARRMKIGRKTAEQHVKAAFKKLGKSVPLKAKTTQLKTDRRGQSDVIESDDQRR